MRLGIPLGWPERPADIGPAVRRIATIADDAGVDSLWTADHFFQIPVTGLPRESPMLEAYATVSYVAALTRRIRIGVMVTSPVYRHPGVLVKSLTTVDVLSGGRAAFGIGVGWDAEEAAALGVPFPPTAERFERLEETLRIARRMWAGDESAYVGRHYRLDRPLNSPNTLQRPGPPILLAGGGERRTLRLVAEYADACNLFDLPAPYTVDLRHKFDVLRQHCADVGRDYAEIEKTTVTAFDLGADRAGGLRKLVDHLHELAAIGVDHAVLLGPRFDWGPDLDAVASIVDEVHGIEVDRR